jgi:DNA polymerase-3 subunit alpha
MKKVATPQFTHLHVHTQYSIFDGQCDVKKLLEKTKELGMNALAITDHGSMFGVFDFHQQARKMGIKPIIGCEFNVVNGSRFVKRGKNEEDSNHLILLAKNLQGYQNLCRLSSLGYTEGFYHRPRIDKEILKKYSEGLICLSGCLNGEIPKLLNVGNITKAEKVIKEFSDIFGGDLYLEMQNFRKPDHKHTNPLLAGLSTKYNIKLVATNDVHFVNKSDSTTHQIFTRFSNTSEKWVYTDGTWRSDEQYLKSAKEMTKLFSKYPEAIANTQEIVDKIEGFELQRDVVLPKFSVPEDIASGVPKGLIPEMVYLRKLTMEEAKERWGDPIPKEVLERLNYELIIIQEIEYFHRFVEGFAGYFLMVWDIIKKAREMGVLVGPGRGSTAGSAVCYALKITNVDPIKHDLLFERFLNPDRISLPDIDIDFDDEGREKVIKYVTEKYGKERVAQIVVIGKMNATGAIRDVAKVLDLPQKETRRLLDLMSLNSDDGWYYYSQTLDQHFKNNPKFAKECKSPNEKNRQTLQYATELEGTIRNTGVHACGIIIAPCDLMDMVPICTSKKTNVFFENDLNMPIVQFEGKHVEDAGLLKLDFLGLSALNRIKKCLEKIKQNHGIDLDINAIPLDDTRTLEIFAKGDTDNIFQFNFSGMQKWLKKLKPDRFEDLIAMNVLYRPGPMDYIPSFIKRKHGKEPICYDLPEMEEILAETYGVTVYQEQVMLLMQKLANFTKGEADSMRKAFGKKQVSIIEKMQPKFIEGCVQNGHDKKICKKIWKDWEAFAWLTFNKSHAVCYSFIAYQTAYLKAHFPEEFYDSLEEFPC